MPIWPFELQQFWLLCLLASAGALGFALIHFTRKARAQDWAVASLWITAGTLVSAISLWLIQMLTWLAIAPGATPVFELSEVAVSVGSASALTAVGLLLLRQMPSLRMGMAVFAAFFALSASVVFGVVAQGLGPLLAPSEMALDRAAVAGAVQLWLPTALGVGAALLMWLAVRQQARVRTGRPAPVLLSRVAVVGGLVALQVLGQVIALRAMHGDGIRWAPTAASAPSAAPAGVNQTLILVLSFAAFLLAMSVLCVVADLRSGRRTTVLRGSLTHAHRKLEELSFWDPLTGLPNRLRFEERIDEALAHLGRHPSAMAVMFIDIDGFKAVNDSRGHAAGDEVLREAGHRLAGLMRPDDTAARVAGDEFLVLMVDPGSNDTAARLAQQVIDALAQPFELTQGGDVRLSCSIGIAMFPEHGPTSRLIAHADAASFAVKRTGGAAYTFFEPRMEVGDGDHLSLQNDLRKAIDNGELELFYQPKIDVRTRAMSGVEALVRWQHVGRGAVASHELIAVAERFGLIGTIGQWVLDQTCRQIRHWHQEGLTIPVAVNLSAHQVRQPELVERVTATLLRHGISPSLITFEITESEAMEDTQATLRCFAQLSRLGVGLSIDDFGTGHSSLAYLRTLPAKQIKIDRSFVADLGTRRDAVPVVEAVIRMAHALGLRVVAEGVETDRQCTVLTNLGCDEFQGYLFARPMSADRLALWACGEESAIQVGQDMPSFADTEPGPIVLQ
jgi:diguanylate cyclase